MELKFEKGLFKDMNKAGFNRTFMELKYLIISLLSCEVDVLIVPLWN